jgi:exopolysaccharide biosynthesis polyprenyl glycosylphosphotransferase
MASRSRQHLTHWKRISNHQTLPIRPFSPPHASETSPIVIPFRKPRKQKAVRTSVLLSLAPGALGEKIRWPLVLLDVLSFTAAALSLQQIMIGQALSFDRFVPVVALQSALTFLLALLDGTYSPRISRALHEQLLILVKASLVAWLVTAVVTRNFLTIACGYGLLSLFALVVFRLARQHYLEHVSTRLNRKNALIVGAGPEERTLADALHSREERERCVVGFLDDRHGPDVLGGIADLARVARAEFVDEIIVGNIARSRLPWVIEEAERNRLDITVVPDFHGHPPAANSFEHLGECALLRLRQADAPAFGSLWKRGLDILGSLIGLIVTAPILATIAILIKFDSKGPVLYRSARAGRKGRQFICFKFRTMIANAEALKEDLRSQNERSGPFFKIAADPRITRVGGWLRRYSLDELPQLWNILRGDMSLVGPRPHPLDDFQRYRLEHFKRLDVTPGLTGLWQVTARSSPSFQQGVALDLDYIARWSFWLDLRILLRTVRAVVSGSGA